MASTTKKVDLLRKIRCIDKTPHQFIDLLNALLKGSQRWGVPAQEKGQRRGLAPLPPRSFAKTSAKEAARGEQEAEQGQRQGQKGLRAPFGSAACAQETLAGSDPKKLPCGSAERGGLRRALAAFGALAGRKHENRGDQAKNEQKKGQKKASCPFLHLPPPPLRFKLRLSYTFLSTKARKMRFHRRAIFGCALNRSAAGPFCGDIKSAQMKPGAFGALQAAPCGLALGRRAIRAVLVVLAPKPLLALEIDAVLG
jgi:hypothetical protein